MNARLGLVALVVCAISTPACAQRTLVTSPAEYIAAAATTDHDRHLAPLNGLRRSYLYYIGSHDLTGNHMVGEDGGQFVLAFRLK